MYYETRKHELFPVANAMEAAITIKEGKAALFHAITYPVDGNKRIYIVSDSHIDDGSFAESAVILQVVDKEFMQIESITAAWCQTPELLADYFNKAFSNPQNMGPANLSIGKHAPDKIASFECGCCGTGFESNPTYQEGFGQDDSYGICTKCEQYYTRYGA